MNKKLIKIKKLRSNSISEQENSIPLFRRGVRKILQLLKTKSAWEVADYILNRSVALGSRTIKSKIALPIKVFIANRFDLASPLNIPKENALISYSVKISGGLGDAIMIARLIRDFQAALKYESRFDIYFHSPNSIKTFFVNIPGFRSLHAVEAFDATRNFYTFSLNINQYISFLPIDKYKKQHIQAFEKLHCIMENCIAENEKSNRYIRTFPALDGEFADITAATGISRYRYHHTVLGIPYGGSRLDIKVEPWQKVEEQLSGKKFITIHDGWDTKFRLVAQRPTKSIPIATLNKVISLIKSRMPDIAIVQLGGETGSDLTGVDYNLKGKLSFKDSLSILAGSSLHIDTESGLVHAATALGVKCIVMFGPTNIQWFAYPENINIAPSECGNCWCSTDTWMDTCPVGYAVPACTSSIDAQVVADAAIEELTKRDKQLENKK